MTARRADRSAAAEEADAALAAVADDPGGRRDLLERFYHRYGGGPAFGRAEIDFMQWEVERGVLAPIGGPKPGSPWWRAVNGHLLRDALEAELLHQQGVGTAGRGSSPAVDRWVEFVVAPSESRWYLAHNSSVLRGYLTHAPLAERESASEQLLMNIVLCRVMLAHAMAAGVELGGLGTLLGDPRSELVGLVTRMSSFYPRHYPLVENDVRRLLHLDDDLAEEPVRLFDDLLVIPHLRSLFAFSERTFGLPRLRRLLQGGGPVYPQGLHRLGLKSPWVSSHPHPLARLVEFLHLLWTELRHRLGWYPHTASERTAS